MLTKLREEEEEEEEEDFRNSNRQQGLWELIPLRR